MQPVDCEELHYRAIEKFKDPEIRVVLLETFYENITGDYDEYVVDAIAALFDSGLDDVRCLDAVKRCADHLKHAAVDHQHVSCRSELLLQCIDDIKAAVMTQVCTSCVQQLRPRSRHVNRGPTTVNLIPASAFIGQLLVK
jgi:hypothetical protein